MSETRYVDEDGDPIEATDIGDLLDEFLSGRNLLFVHDTDGNKYLVSAGVTFESTAD